MTESNSPGLDIHFVEAGGRGGIFQHTVGVAQELVEAGNRVVIHTAFDHESPVSGVTFCGCVQWARQWPSPVRQLATGLGFALKTTRHLRRVATNADVVHVEGWFHALLTRRLVRRLRATPACVAFTPHNTFSRSATRWALRCIMDTARSVDLVFVFSQADRTTMANWGVESIQIDLHLQMPNAAVGDIEKWRTAWGSSRIALLPGNIRVDKDPEMFVASLALLPDVRGAVIGVDAGGMDLLAAASRRLAVPIDAHVGYHELEQFVAAIAAADVVVLPYVQSSSSGVAAFARRLGTPVVASAIGGLAGQASHPVEERTPEGFAAAISLALEQGRLVPWTVRGSGEAHFAGYRSALAAGIGRDRVRT